MATEDTEATETTLVRPLRWPFTRTSSRAGCRRWLLLSGGRREPPKTLKTPKCLGGKPFGVFGASVVPFSPSSDQAAAAAAV